MGILRRGEKMARSGKHQGERMRLRWFGHVERMNPGTWVRRYRRIEEESLVYFMRYRWIVQISSSLSFHLMDGKLLYLAEKNS